jgi:putative Holliday junction resolvase
MSTVNGSSPISEIDPQSGRVAGIDYGTVRIGVALSDGRRKIASPFQNYNRCGPQGDALYFQRLVKNEGVVLFVVGLPIHLDGHESGKSHEARQFGKWLAEATGIPVEYFDERYTSAQAEELLLGAELTRKRRKARLDMLAAQIMLSAWLEARLRGEESAQGLNE